MNHLLLPLVSVFLIFCAATAAGASDKNNPAGRTSPPSAGERILTAFDGQDSLRWQTVNDGVMGGRSRGDSSRTQSGTLRFAGEISLKNNGGFSSIRTRPQDLRLGGYDGLVVRVRGDGRTYKLSLRTSGTSRWIAYWADFATTKGQWTTVRIPFSKWVPTTFGRKLPGPRLRPASINSVGFMLYDKKAGPFSLEVASIASYRRPAEPKAVATERTNTILTTARSAGTFKTLLAAAEAADLVDLLSKSGPVTVFAPTDAAFAKLPAGTVENLLEPENRNALKRILLHHIVRGRVHADAAAAAETVPTLAGTELRFRYAGGLQVSGTRIIASDLPARNGVIHVVGSVLLPPKLETTIEIPRQDTPTRAIRMIERAIATGVPLYNNGKPEACCTVYELAATALIGLDGELFSSRVRERLETAIDSSESPEVKAWTLRRALDAAYRESNRALSKIRS